VVLKIGLTGGIGSGKSIVAHVFNTMGIPVFDADSAAKNIMNEDETLKAKIIQTFGVDSYTDGQLNRKYIANIVFNDNYKLEQLNALVHPAAIQAAKDWMKKQNAPYVIKEAALLFESGSAEGLDFVIGVFAPQALRIKRVMERDSVTRDEVLKRINRQIDEDIKRLLCDFVLINDEQQLLLTQVTALHEKLLQISREKA